MSQLMNVNEVEGNTSVVFLFEREMLDAVA
jgi:hypothetical protein